VKQIIVPLLLRFFRYGVQTILNMCCCCFPASVRIWTETGSHLVPELRPSAALSTLRIGKSGEPDTIKPDTFYTYLHFDAEAKAEFLVIQCDNGQELTITGSHLLFKKSEDGSTVPVPAGSIQIGDSLVHVEEDKMSVTSPRVSQLGTVTLTGIYAPLTKSGTLIVNGFLVSCYADVESHAKAHASLAPLRLWYRSIMTKAVVPKETKCERGIHGYAKFLMKLRQRLPYNNF
jgi:hypothetical protein